MSKTTVKKALEGFNADELRQLIIDIYSRSKDVKEILDFYAEPDIAKKLEEYKKPIIKEVWRVSHRYNHPRIMRIRRTIQNFKRLDPGDEAVGQLMAFTILEYCKMGSTTYNIIESVRESAGKLFAETLDFLDSRMMLDEYRPQFAKAIREMRDFTKYRNPIKTTFLEILNKYAANNETL